MHSFRDTFGIVPLRLRTSPPAGIAIRVEPARPLPVDWYRWRDAVLAGAPLAPIVEGFTEPEGWSVTIVEVATGEGLRVHAFYAIFDQAIHAWAALPADASAAVRAGVRAAFAQAAPAWPDAIVALGQL